MNRQLPFGLETDVERQLTADASWQRGAWWGAPRSGHPEGAVAYHIAEVLANVDRFYPASPDRNRLRLIALAHDTFKHAVDPKRPKTGDNHHGAYAAHFLERFTSDQSVLLVTRTHDEAYNAWEVGFRRADWSRAESRARQLLDTLDNVISLYLSFYRCDNATGDKRQDPYEWFEHLVNARK